MICELCVGAPFGARYVVGNDDGRLAVCEWHLASAVDQLLASDTDLRLLVDGVE